MIEIDIKAPNVIAMLRALRTFREDQVPFAMSLAMNRAALDARERVRPLMRQVFNLRSPTVDKAVGPFGRLSERGTGSKTIANRGWSHRTQWPNLHVVFGSTSHGLARQEYGGKKPNRSTRVWIATKYIKYQGGASAAKKIGRHTPSKILRAMEKKEPSLTKSGKARKRTGQYRIFERNGTIFERTRATGETVPLYLLRSRANVPPRMNLEGMIRDTYQAKIWPRFVQAMDLAMSTAKESNRFTKRP